MNQLALNFTSPSDRERIVAVLRMIRERNGRAAAISMHAISKATEIPTREIQAIVKFLVEERQRPIGTATTKPYGYFWITTNDERRQCRNQFLRRALSNLEHAKAFDADAIVAPLIGQFPLDLGKEDV